jgi:isopentenyl diphosphate isomerase/L-lactate dehydrogenase-like FMN-dependent dehydrogenase
MPFAKAARVSSTEVEKLIEKYGHELRVAMFGMGAKRVADLYNSKLVERV